MVTRDNDIRDVHAMYMMCTLCENDGRWSKSGPSWIALTAKLHGKVVETALEHPFPYLYLFESPIYGPVGAISEQEPQA